MKRIFVSYSRKNRTIAERLARDLNDAGLEVWIDFRSIHGGELWQDAIFKGIAQAEIIVICLTPDSVSSEWVRREILLARGQHKFIIPVMLEECINLLSQYDETKSLLDIQIVDFRTSYEQAFPDLLRALPGLHQNRTEVNIESSSIQSPFKGLEAFQQTDAEVFFGREDLIQKVIERIESVNTSRFLAVVGASGSGKSSIVRAGLIPAIRAGSIKGSDTWPIVIFTPGSEPIREMATRLLPVIGGNRVLPEIVDVLESKPENLDLLITGLLATASQDTKALLIIDQFEEVFTRASQQIADLFLKMIVHAVTYQGGRTQVCITMRADFFDRLSNYPDLAGLFEERNLIIATSLTLDNLRKTIEGPAQVVGLKYDEGLTDRILEDIQHQPGSLPLLEYALTKLYENRDGNRLTYEAYQAIGGVKRALARHAEDIYQKLDEASQKVIHRVLLQLIEVSELGEATRRRVRLNDLVFRNVPEESIKNVIDQLTASDTRLLIANREITSNQDTQDAPTIWIEVSHEALIREWDRFSAWVIANKENLAYGSELLKEANNWDRANRDEEYLLEGKRLERSIQWLSDADANPLQVEFVEASNKAWINRQQEEQRQQEQKRVLQQRATRLLQFTIALVAFLAIAIGLSVIAFRSQLEAVQARETSVFNQNFAGTQAADAQLRATNASAARSSDLRVQRPNDARNAIENGNFDNGIGLLLRATKNESVNNSDSDRSDWQKLLADVGYGPVKRRISRSKNIGDFIAISPDGLTALTKVAYQVIDINSGIERFTHTPAPIITPYNFFSTFTAQPSAQPSATEEIQISAAAFSPDMELAVYGTIDGQIILWQIAAKAQILRWRGQQSQITEIQFTSDGKRIISSSLDGTLRVWDSFSGSEIYRYSGPYSTYGAHVSCFAINPVEDSFIFGTSDGQVIEINLETFEYSEIDIAASNVVSIGLSHDGQKLLVVSQRPASISESHTDFVELWNLLNHKFIRSFPFPSNNDDTLNIAFNEDESQVLALAKSGNFILWDSITGEVLSRYSPPNDENYKPLLNFAQKNVIFGSSSKFLIIDISFTARFRSIYAHDKKILNLTFNSTGKELFSASLDGYVRVWNTIAGLEMRRYSIPSTTGLLTVALNTSDTTAISGYSDGRIIEWDLETGREIKRFSGNYGALVTLSLATDSRLLLTAYRTDKFKYLVLWNVETAASLHRYQIQDDAELLSINITPNSTSSILVFADGSTKLLDFKSESIVNILDKNSTHYATLAANGNDVFAITSNGELIQSSLKENKIVSSLQGHQDFVSALSVSRDSQMLASCNDQGMIILWKVIKPSDLVREIESYYTIPPSVENNLASEVTPDASSILTATQLMLENQTVLTDLGNSHTTSDQIGTATEIAKFINTQVAVIALTPSLDRVTFTPMPPPTFTIPSSSVLSPTPSMIPSLWPSITPSDTPDTPTSTLTASTTASITLPPNMNLFQATATAIVATNQKVEIFLRQTQTASGEIASTMTQSVIALNTPKTQSTLLNPTRQAVATLDKTQEFANALLTQVSKYATATALAVLLSPYNTDVTKDSDAIYDSSVSATGTALAVLLSGEEISATPSQTDTPLPTQTSTPSPTASPESISSAEIGTNRGELHIGSGSAWIYDGHVGETITIEAQADRPANGASISEQDLEGLLDTRLILYSPDGELIEEADDIVPFINTNSKITNFVLPKSGVYRIEVRSYRDANQGAYSLIIKTGG